MGEVTTHGPFYPFKEFTHGGTLNVPEILFHTRFDYMFPLAAANAECTLPTGATTQGALLSLGDAMATDTLAMANDSTIPAVFTYLGQFIDHNITAQTDREIGVSRIATPDGMVMDLTPLPASEVSTQLINGRRPLLDLSQVYGDGPPLGAATGVVSAGPLFEEPGKLLKVAAAPPGFDVPRTDNGTAIIADMRNNENLNVCQLHCAFLLFHNKVAEGLPAALTADERFIRAQQLVRWSYQYIVLNDYLTTVCDPAIVADIQANGLRYYSPDDDTLFMPLEFSVAAFRFGHSMIRPNYEINATTTLTLAQVLGVPALLGPGAPPQIDGPNIIEWHNFADIPGHPGHQFARKIDPLLSADLGNLPVNLPGSSIPIGALLRHLARRNLLRGFVLSIPTGQAVASAMMMNHLTPAQLKQDVSKATVQALEGGHFDEQTPLWYYILREAALEAGGDHLGGLGSRIVAETLYALVSRDRSSYLNNASDAAVTPAGIDLGGGTVIASIGDLLVASGAPI